MNLTTLRFAIDSPFGAVRRSGRVTVLISWINEGYAANETMATHIPACALSRCPCLLPGGRHCADDTAARNNSVAPWNRRLEMVRLGPCGYDA